jgi:hypothetical protein
MSINHLIFFMEYPAASSASGFSPAKRTRKTFFARMDCAEQ